MLQNLSGKVNGGGIIAMGRSLLFAAFEHFAALREPFFFPCVISWLFD